MSLTPAALVETQLPPGRNAEEKPSGRWVPYLISLFFFIVYATWSVNRHERLRTGGYDLGIFEQAVRGYAHFSAPVAAIKGPGFNLLGDHFHPVLIAIAPFYRLFPSPLTLLIAQAALIAVSAIPIARLALAGSGIPGSLGAGVAYGLSWGLQAAVNFDFHEVAFAVPMVSFSLVAIVEKRWRAAALWAIPLVLVKEDLTATLAAIGLLLILRGRRRLGSAVILFAVAAAAAIVGIIVPAFNPNHVYAYTLNTAPNHQNPLKRMLTPSIKWHTLGQLLAPTGFLPLFSSVGIVAVPTLAWRFWSTDPLYWGTMFQYSAVLMPIVFVALLEVISRSSLFGRDVRRRRAVSVAAAAVAITATFAAPWPVRGLTNGKNWQADSAVTEAKTILADVPDGSTVAADNHLAPQLTSRCTVYLFPSYPGFGVDPEWVVYRTPLDTSMAAAASVEAEIGSLSGKYVVVARNSSAVLMRRR